MLRDKTKGKTKGSDETGVVVSAQQTRFQDLTTGGSLSRELKLEIYDLTITVNGRDLLQDAHLKLEESVHYVLVGRNGTGKSTLLQAIAEERIPGVPWNMRCALLGQTLTTNGDDSFGQNESRQETALEYVLRSDSRREIALRESKVLSEALNSDRPLDAVRGVRKIKHQRLEQILKRAQLVAARRSGARGWDARADLLAVEKQVADSQTALDQPDSEVDPSSIEAETKEAVEMLDQIQDSLESQDWSSSEARARDILQGLRFSSERLATPVASLSGGWRTRCELAAILFQRLDLLLLDEPTNFLDLPSVIWLQHYLEDVSCTVVVVTHDRDFADAVAEKTIILRDNKLDYFDGNLSLYESERNAKIKQMTRIKDAHDKKTAHIQKSIEHGRSAAKKHGDDKRMKQVKSRQKKLEDRGGLEVSAKGTRFKLNRDLTGYHLTSRAEIDIPQNDPTVKMAFPTETADLRFPGALVAVEKVSYKYPKTKDMVLNDATLSVHLTDRIGIVGANGSGKSTLVKLVVANEDDAKAPRPTTGSITKHPRLRIGYFSQHSTDELSALCSAHPTLTALQHLMETSDGGLSEPDAYGMLGNVGLPGRLASEVPIASLSGGQRVRLALAKLTWRPPQLLVLDEVTTHLDADTIIALIEVLKTFKGALLVVTHDRFFMRCVVEGERIHPPSEDSSSEEEGDDIDEEAEKERRRVVYRMIKGQLKPLERGMAQYEEIVSRKWKKS